MDNATLETPNGVEHGEIPEIEAAILADSARWKTEGREGLEEIAPRDDKGRFTSTEEAGKPADEQEPGAQRAGAETKEGKASEAKGPATEQSDKQQQSSSAPKETAAADKAKGSAWAKENERKAKTWEAINETKKAIEADREQLKIEREQFIAQQQSTRTLERDAHGFTAAQYEANGKRFAANAASYQQKAMEAETRGNLEEADQFTAKAEEETQLAKAAAQRAETLRGAGTSAVWQKLTADLPEAMQHGSQLNTELRALLRGNREFLGDQFGPYRAAVQIGRKVLQKTEADLAAAKAEAGKVPELQKQIAELSERVKELTRLTSLPGGGAATVREGSEGRKFEDMTLEQMEAELNRER